MEEIKTNAKQRYNASEKGRLVKRTADRKFYETHRELVLMRKKEQYLRRKTLVV